MQKEREIEKKKCINISVRVFEDIFLLLEGETTIKEKIEKYVFIEKLH